MAITSIHGPIISTADSAAQRHVLEDVYGLEVVSHQSLSAQEVERTWGVTGQSAETWCLNTPGTSFGVRLVQFEHPGEPIRNPDTGYDCHALKVIDFYAPNFDAGVDRIENAGFHVKDEIADYDLPEGHFREAHLWGPDNVVTATISGPEDFFRNFATTHDRVYSEPQSISGPVADPEAVIDFYDRVLGLSVIFRYGIDDESFADLVGTDGEMRLRAWNIGLKTTEPYFGIIHYGLPESEYNSLYDRAVMPNTGLVGMSLLCDDLAAVHRVAQTYGSPIIAPPASVTLAPWGDVTSMVLRGPHGVLHHLVQPG